MHRPLRPCPTPGCPALVPGGYCARHRRERETRRGSAWARGYDRHHQALRAVLLPRADERGLIDAALAHAESLGVLPIAARDKVCRGCMAQVPTVLEHAIRIEDGGETSEANCWGACAGCANYKTATEQRDPTFGRRLRAAGAHEGHVVPMGWRYLVAFGGGLV